ncbi:cytochrome P450 [Mycena rebaudengoi]|nr:cytochrome P450 [Mycena rebaudengoi]
MPRGKSATFAVKSQLIKALLQQERLVISDPLALQYIIKSANFHHAQRKYAANSALYGAKSVPSLQALSVGFTATAVSEYQAALERIAKKASDELEVNSGKSINVCPLLGSAALSAASELVFGVEELDNDLVGDIVKIMPRWPGQSKSEILIDGIGARFPAFFRAATLYLRSFNLLRNVQAQATRVGRQILRERVAAIESRTVDYGHDLYTKLLADTSSSKRKLTDDEITEQTSVLLVAGHETTATTLAFGLLELGRNPEFQQKIRDELNARQGDVVYDSLHLLNAFIKEVLRMYPAAALRERVALKDEIIPLSEGIATTTGQRITQIPIRKGDQVVLALATKGCSPFGEMMQTVSTPTAGLMAKYIKAQLFWWSTRLPWVALRDKSDSSVRGEAGQATSFNPYSDSSLAITASCRKVINYKQTHTTTQQMNGLQILGSVLWAVWWLYTLEKAGWHAPMLPLVQKSGPHLISQNKIFNQLRPFNLLQPVHIRRLGCGEYINPLIKKRAELDLIANVRQGK